MEAACWTCGILANTAGQTGRVLAEREQEVLDWCNGVHHLSVALGALPLAAGQADDLPAWRGVDPPSDQAF